MSEPRAEFALRPLALGEALDRAVNLCVRHFIPLSLVFLVYAVPLAVVQYFASRDFAGIMQTFTQTIAAGAGKPPDPQVLARTLGAVHPSGWFALSVALAFFVAPLPSAALISATTRFYLGEATSFGQAYRVALDRWLPLVGVNVVYTLAFVALYVAFVVVMFVVLLTIVLLASAMRAVGITLDVILALLAFGAMAACFVVAALALQVSYFTCVVERASVSRAFSMGISRVLSGVGLRRSLLVGMVFIALGCGILIVSAIGEALLNGLLHNAVLGTAYATIVRIATAAFTTAFVGIFYFDLRVREEGLDLQIAAQRTYVAAPPA